MGATDSISRPNWQRSRVFKFFASVKLAVILLAVLIVAAIAGTIYESSFDAKVARAYVYGAPWFNVWLILLGANLTVSALSRWPWKKHHVAFLITHLGIITLLTGSLIGRIWGTEGTMTLLKASRPPTVSSSININSVSATPTASAKVTPPNFCIIRRPRSIRATLVCSRVGRA